MFWYNPGMHYDKFGQIRNATSRGLSMAELIVVLGLAGMIMYSVSLLIRSGLDYYFYSTDTLEVQKRALFAVSRITNELTYSNIDGVAVFNVPSDIDEDDEFKGTETVPGVVFASARNAAGDMQRDLDGRPEWSRLICYYVGEVDDLPLLLRREEGLAAPTTLVPDPVLGFAPPRTAAYFGGNGTLTTQQVARGVSMMRSRVLTDAIEIRFRAEVKGARNLFEMDIHSKIIPRN